MEEDIIASGKVRRTCIDVKKNLLDIFDEETYQKCEEKILQAKSGTSSRFQKSIF